jgi:hypothetical protein
MNSPLAERATTSAESAFDLARRGHLASSARAIEKIRREVNIEERPNLAVDVLFIEAVIAAYMGDWDRAKDRITRSLAICKILNESNRTLRSLAWMSFIQFNTDRLLESARTAVSVLIDKQLRDHATRFRAAVVFASLLQYADLGELADRWFTTARRSADLASDLSLKSVAIFNSVLTRVAVKRFNQRISHARTHDLKLTSIFANSAQNFDSYGGIELNLSCHALLRAQILALQEDYAAAALILNPLLSNKSLGKDNSALVHFENLRCIVRGSPSTVTAEYIRSVELLLPNLAGDDELSIAFSTLSESYQLIGMLDRSTDCFKQSTEAAERFTCFRDALAVEMQTCVSIVNSA